MILFLEDWDKYPHAIVDTNTKNKSAVHMAILLKAMGIENHAFPLALHNPLLQNIDPHSDSLSKEEITMITEECKENPWYFFREVTKVPARSGPDMSCIEFNRGNIALWWLFFNHITTLLIQCRQTGKSLSADTLTSYLFAVAALFTDINLFTKDDALRVKNIKRIKEIIDGYPSYLKLKSKNDINNTEKMTLSRLGNTFTSTVAQSSPKAAANLLRGATVAVNQIDEIAFIANIQHSFAPLLAASVAARELAKENGAHYGNIFTTTAGFLSTESGEFAYGIYNDCLRWTEKLLDCKNLEDLESTIRKNSPSGKVQVLCEFNHRQLGKTDEWLAERIEVANSEGENAEADFLNKWQEGNERSPLDKNVLARIVASEVSDAYCEISNFGYILRWYIPAHEVESKKSDRIIVVGLDTSEAIGKDDISLVGTDYITGETVCAGSYNETNTITFADFITDLIINNPNMIFVIERKNTGVTIIDHLLKLLPAYGIDPFKRLFNWVVEDAVSDEKLQKEVLNVPLNRRHDRFYDKYRSEFGYQTQGAGRSARDNLYGSSFNMATKYIGHLCKDPVLIKQITRLVSVNNRIDHRKGEHDDLVIAWLLDYWFLANSKNLQHYGISPRLVLSTVTNRIIEEKGGIEAIKNTERQIGKKKQIEELIEKAKKEPSTILQKEMVNRIRMLYSDLDKEITTTFNIDSLIEDINIERQKKYRGW